MDSVESSILQQIISRYENEENNFLKEVEALQQQCANTDTSTDDVQEEPTPVLGTLCNLVGEISHLRKENRKLRRRLVDSSANARSTTQVSSSSSASRKVVDRVNAFLEKNGRRHSTAFLPRLITTAVNAGHSSKSCLMSSGSSSGIFNQRSNTMEARHGARERLSSPPQKDSLTVSSYSADLSSDTLSSYNRRKSTPKAPPLVLPEEMDSEMESNVFHEVALPGYPREIEAIEKEEIYQCGNRSRRSMTRRSSRSQLSATDFSSLSEHTSPSSASASSSVEPNDHMTSSRSSFLELIGLRRKREKLPPASPVEQIFGVGKSVSLKKRKRKISGTDTCNPLANGEKRYSAIYMRENKDARSKHQSENMFESTDLENWSEKIAATSVESMDREVKRNSQLNSKINSSGNNSAKGACERRLRPKSMIYLDPTKIPAKSICFKGKAKSCKSVNNPEHLSSSSAVSVKKSFITSRNAFEIDDELLLHYRHENSQLKNEIHLLKSRNNRLIDQLREKSMQMSVMQSQKNQLEIETEELRRKEQFNELVHRLCLKKRFAHSFEAGFSSMEQKLCGFQKQIHALSDTFKNQQAAINASFREHSSYHEACLEQIERLQRENFSLLQMQAAASSLSGLMSKRSAVQQNLDSWLKRTRLEQEETGGFSTKF